jgi:hypothetical protein
MEYLIPIVLLVLLATAFVTFVMLRATRRSNVSPLGDATEDAGTESTERDEDERVPTPESERVANRPV